MQAKSASIVNDLPTNNKHKNEKFIRLKSPSGFGVGLTWRVADGNANEVTSGQKYINKVNQRTKILKQFGEGL